MSPFALAVSGCDRTLATTFGLKTYVSFSTKFNFAQAKTQCGSGYSLAKIGTPFEYEYTKMAIGIQRLGISYFHEALSIAICYRAFRLWKHRKSVREFAK